eukprot:Awhi_evm1s8853
MGTRVLDIVIRTFCETWLSSPAPLRSILENLQQKFSQDEIQQAIGRQYTSACKSRLLENLQCLTKDEKEKYEIYFKELLAETEEVQTQEPESDSQFLADDFFDLPVTLPVSVKIETEDQNTECTGLKHPFIVVAVAVAVVAVAVIVAVVSNSIINSNSTSIISIGISI